jgi:hypothetical protein
VLSFIAVAALAVELALLFTLEMLLPGRAFSSCSCALRSLLGAVVVGGSLSSG